MKKREPFYFVEEIYKIVLNGPNDPVLSIVSGLINYDRDDNCKSICQIKSVLGCIARLVLVKEDLSGLYSHGRPRPYH